MLSRQLKVLNKAGLHARPAAAFVQEARRFESAVTLRKDGRAADAKSILSVLALGVNQGSAIEMEASGVDESAALEALAELIESKFGEK